jgi:AraC family transcriptional regulator
MQEHGMVLAEHLSTPLFPTALLAIPDEDVRGMRSYPDPHIEIACSGSGQRTLRVGLRELDVGTSRGMIEIYRAGYEISQTRWQGVRGDCIAVTFPRAVTDKILRGEENRLQVATAHGLFDGQIARLGHELAQEWRQGLPHGPLFSEGLSIALLGLLMCRPTHTRHEHPGSVGFSYAQKRTINELIDSELANHLTVEQMAIMMEMNSYQFSRRFKSSFGMSPYQYVLQRRLDTAVRKLEADCTRPIAEIALETGFSNQAHLTSAFRKYLGTTPARSRSRALRDKR